MPTWIESEAAEYDERRELFNAMIDKKPRIIAACEGPADVREALERAAHDARLPRRAWCSPLIVRPDCRVAGARPA